MAYLMAIINVFVFSRGEFQMIFLINMEHCGVQYSSRTKNAVFRRFFFQEKGIWTLKTQAYL